MNSGELSFPLETITESARTSPSLFVQLEMVKADGYSSLSFPPSMRAWSRSKSPEAAALKMSFLRTSRSSSLALGAMLERRGESVGAGRWNCVDAEGVFERSELSVRMLSFSNREKGEASPRGVRELEGPAVLPSLMADVDELRSREREEEVARMVMGAEGEGTSDGGGAGSSLAAPEYTKVSSSPPSSCSRISPSSKLVSPAAPSSPSSSSPLAWPLTRVAQSPDALLKGSEKRSCRAQEEVLAEVVVNGLDAVSGSRLRAESGSARGSLVDGGRELLTPQQRVTPHRSQVLTATSSTHNQTTNAGGRNEAATENIPASPCSCFSAAWPGGAAGKKRPRRLGFFLSSSSLTSECVPTPPLPPKEQNRPARDSQDD